MQNIVQGKETESKEQQGDPVRLDVEKALERLGGLKRLYIKILQNVLTDPSVQKEELERLLAAGDMKAAERLVHTVKGFGGSIGADGLYKIGEQLELLCRDNMVASQPDVLARFQTELENTLEAVRQYLAREGQAG